MNLKQVNGIQPLLNPNYGKPIGFQAPLSMRVGLRLSFYSTTSLMNLDRPVGETWRAGFLLCAFLVAAGTARADARASSSRRARRTRPLEPWQKTLTSAAATERAAAAFALGQLGMAWEPVGAAARAKAEAALLGALAGEKDATVRDRLVEALGKVGGRGSDGAGGAVDGKERVRAAVASRR